MTSSWQSRLSAKANVISQKLIDNSIALSGTLTDVLVIRLKEDIRLDAQTINLEDITTTNMIFPKMEDIPLFRFLNSTYAPSDTTSFIVEEDQKPIVVTAPVSSKIDQGSLIVRVFEFPDQNLISGTRQAVSTAPWVLILRVADVLGTFGARSMVWQKMNLTYPNTPMPPKIKDYILQIATRRELLKW